MLEGSLSDFSLPDIFQLIALTKKSGALTVKVNGQEGKVLFRDGEVRFAVADVRRVALGARLVASGMVEEQQVTRVLERKRDEGGDLFALLLDEAVLDEGALDTFLRVQIQDAVFELMRLDDATFSFDAQEDAIGAGLAVATDQLIAEGSRRMAEWETIRERIPALDAILELSPQPFTDDGTVALGIDDWRLLALVDGRRTVQDIVELTGQGEFETSKRLAELVQRGFVRVPGGGPDGALAGMVARREMLRRLEALELGEPVMRPEPPAPRTPAPDTPASRPTLVGSATGEPAASPARPQPAARSAVDGPGVPRPAAAAVGGRAAATALLDTALEADDSEPATQAPDAASESQASMEESGAPAADAATTDNTVVDVDAPDDAADPNQDPPAPAPEVDRWQVARELSSLGRDAALPPAPAPAREQQPTTAAQPATEAPEAAPAEAAEAVNGTGNPDAPTQGRPLTRDEDVNKGLLLRLIDGLKEA